ncbi:MAG: hypothetical protein WCJ55_20030 [Chloroflexales bacterium]
MLDQIDVDLKLSKSDYNQRLDDMQARLYDMEQALLEAKAPVLIVFEGWAGTAKVRTISVLTQRLDPRGVRVHPITPPRTYEAQYPWLYRFWLKIPSYGQVAIFDRSWYRQALAERTHRSGDAAIWRDRCEDMAAFERQLAADGVVMLKFWMHISQNEQRRRFKRLLADPLTAWQVTEEDQWQHHHYAKVYAAVEDMIARTDTVAAPWHLIPATDKYYARIAVFDIILRALEARLGRPAVALAPATRAAGPDLSGAAFRHQSDPPAHAEVLVAPPVPSCQG